MSSYHYSFYSPADFTADIFFNNGFIGLNGFLLLGNFNNGFNGLIGLSLTVAEVSGLRNTKSDCNDWYYRLLRRPETSATDGAPIESV